VLVKAILAAIDFSKCTEFVVAQAAALARALHGKVVLVTVLVEPVFVKEYAPLPPGLAKISVANEPAVRARLQEIRQRLESEFVPAEGIVRRGNAALHILQEAEEHAAAFIVVGSHGHTPFFELVAGSTTQAVLKRARQPVVVIPREMREVPRPQLRVVAFSAED
jgi:nucleotide-binding universal stress UspA family protein